MQKWKYAQRKNCVFICRKGENLKILTFLSKKTYTKENLYLIVIITCKICIVNNA